MPIGRDQYLAPPRQHSASLPLPQCSVWCTGHFGCLEWAARGGRGRRVCGWSLMARGHVGKPFCIGKNCGQWSVMLVDERPLWRAGEGWGWF